MASVQAIKTVGVMEDAMESVWPDLKKILAPIKSNSDLKKRTELLDLMLDKVGEDEDHPLAFVCDSLGRLIEEYEKKAFPIRESSPSEVLSFLIEQGGLKQKDLSDILPQSNLSAFLKGKRSLSPIQIARLSVRFGVSPTVFLPLPDYNGMNSFYDVKISPL
jgi:HTH-type transcriptional regulator / antitoxin HigA